MKTLITILLVIGVAAATATIIHRSHHAVATVQPAETSSPVAKTAPATPVVSPMPMEPTPTPVAAIEATVTPASAMSAVAPAPTRPASPIHQAVDALLSAHGAGQKQVLFDQLRKTGQLEQVIADLKQRMADNPTDPEIPTTLGEAQINQLRAIKESGGDYNQIGILAMQADQNFNAALQIDPRNWEAQFVKSAAMFYWPANPQMDSQVVQNLSGLIDQQETMPPDPGFAQTYVVLGSEYQKIGQPDKAAATWQLGLQKFPNDPALQQKIAGQ